MNRNDIHIGSARNGLGKADMTDADFNPIPGIAIPLAKGLQRILVPNPSPMTYRGTNTYLVGDKSVAIIDPGPADASHLSAIMSALSGRDVSHIIVTHSHLDHSPLAQQLSESTGAPVLAFGNSQAGRSDVMTALAAGGLAGGGEGVDDTFAPDLIVVDGDIIEGQGWTLRVLHTPGHMGNHIALGWNRSVFTGDLVMGWASSLVSPPDGDLDDFLASCQRLRDYGAEVFYPGHGAPVVNTTERLDWLVDHRNTRTCQILKGLEMAPQTAQSLASLIYTDLPAGLLQAATRNVFAHLVSLHSAGRVAVLPTLRSDAVFRLSEAVQEN